MNKLLSLEVQKGGHRVFIRPAPRADRKHIVGIDGEILLRTVDYDLARDLFRSALLAATIGEISILGTFSARRR